MIVHVITPWALPTAPHLPRPRARTDDFNVCVDLPFPEHHVAGIKSLEARVVGITEHVAFSRGLLFDSIFKPFLSFPPLFIKVVLEAMFMHRVFSASVRSIPLLSFIVPIFA